MSQYAYIPIDKAGQLQEVYTIANPTTWQFKKGEVQFGGLEEVEFSSAQTTEILALDGNWFDSATSFMDWLNQH